VKYQNFKLLTDHCSDLSIVTQDFQQLIAKKEGEKW